MEKRKVLRIRILNAEPFTYSDKARKILKKIGEVTEEAVRQERLGSRVKDFDVLIVRLGLNVNKKILAAANKLKVVVTATTGVEHIDIKTAKKQNIAVLSLQGEKDFLRKVSATAEYTWAIILSLIRRIPWAFNDVCRGNWRRDLYRGHELSGRHLGIIGLGRVGRQVAHYGLAFGMKVGFYDSLQKKTPKGVRSFRNINALLRWSHILSIHLSLNAGNRGLLNEKLLRLLPKGACIVNTSRGACLDERALLRLLKRGHISAAALDVLCDEQSEQKRNKNPLIRYACHNDNLLITPHLGGATLESMEKTEVFMAKQLRSFFKKNFK